jgi:ABC-type transporter Mla subunit MlaD
VIRKLSDQQIATAAERLRARGGHLGWRQLQALLRAEYGVTGRTDRLRAACRAANRTTEQCPPSSPLQRHIVDAQQQVLEALRERDQALERALRSEERETAHQDRWAGEIHSLRETVEQLQGERARRQNLEEQLQRLQRELRGLYARLSRYER